MPTDSQACACSLSRHSPYASELEYIYSLTCHKDYVAGTFYLPPVVV